MRRRAARRTALVAGMVALVVAVRRRLRRPAPSGGGMRPAPAPIDLREAADGDLADEREISDRPAPASSAMSHDPEAPEADALAQAQDVGGELLPHDVVPDDRPLPDALDQAAVVDDPE